MEAPGDVAAQWNNEGFSRADNRHSWHANLSTLGLRRLAGSSRIQPITPGATKRAGQPRIKLSRLGEPVN